MCYKLSRDLVLLHPHNFHYLICIHYFHDPFLEKLVEDLRGDAGCFLHQGELTILLHSNGVRHNSTDVYLQAEYEALMQPHCSTQAQQCHLLSVLSLFQN